MGVSCCKGNFKNGDELTVHSAQFEGDEGSQHNMVKQESGANKRSSYMPAQTFGAGLLLKNKNQDSKEQYKADNNSENRYKNNSENPQTKNSGQKGSKPNILLLDRQDSATDRKKQGEKVLSNSIAQQKLLELSLQLNSNADIELLLDSDVQQSKKEMKVNIDLFVQLKKGTISDYYETGEVLGEGAFGKVWKVTHKTTRLMRAMKSIKKSGILREEQERLFSEMNILKHLDHAHIVKLYELFEDAKNYYLVTEYCSGGELFDRIKSMNHFSEKYAAEIMKQILMAVVYCHSQNIVHRDLKPENLLFVSNSPESKIKVIDFGTSRKFDGQKKMTKRLGTPYYIAPEVLLENYNEKCDVWSCGVILFIMLCGYPPFSGRTEDDILKKVKSGKFKFDPEDWHHISIEAQNLITNMLTLNPQKRMTAESALNDPWISANAPNNAINQRSLHNLQTFQARSKFKQALLTFIATQIITQQDQEDLQQAFQAIDTNGDGMLSKEELIVGYTQVCKNRDEAIQNVDKIMDIVDINRSGKVDFTEFIIAAMNQEKLLSVEKMNQAFVIIDLDGDNYISKEELEYVMGDIDDDIWQQILLECDSDNDGKISLEEFSGLLRSKV